MKRRRHEWWMNFRLYAAGAGLFLLLLVTSVYGHYKPEYFEHALQANVLITAPQGFGSGVIIGQNRVLTAGHLGLLKQNTPATVFFENGGMDNPVAVYEERNDEQDTETNLDYAILQVPVPHHYEPATPRCTPVSPGEPVFVVGNPGDFRSTIHRGNVARVQDQVYANRILVLVGGLAPGISGAAVYSEVDWRLIGIVVEGTNGGRMALVIPATVIGTGENALCPTRTPEEAARQTIQLNPESRP